MGYPFLRVGFEVGEEDRWVVVGVVDRCWGFGLFGVVVVVNDSVAFARVSLLLDACCYVVISANDH